MSTATRDFVPSFTLYGEAPNNNLPDLIHVEALKDRSQLYGWQIKPHRHAGLVQIIDFKTPNVQIDLDGVIKKTDSPSILMVPPTVVHGFEFAPDVVGSVTTIPQDLFIDATATMAPWAQSAVLISEQDDSFVHLAHILQQIEDEYNSRRSARENALLLLVSLIGVWIERIRPAQADLRGIDVHESPAQRRIRSFLDLVEQGYLKGWSALDYGKAIGVSKSQLTRDCRTILGRSPLQVIHDRIIKEANRKLAYTPLSVAEISDRLGFTDLGYFSRFYRQKTGKTPTDYRGRIRKQMHRKP